jgi:hypothetical protein
LVASGCAMTGKSHRRNYRRSYGSSKTTTESVRAHVSVPQISTVSTGSSGRYRPSKAPRRIRPMPPSPSSSVRRLSRRSPGRSSSDSSRSSRHRIRKAAKVKVVSGRRNPTATTPAVAKGARVPMTRLVIYQGTMVLRVFKLRDAADLAQKLALETGAYIQTRHNSRMVIRVPVNRFHQLMARLSAIGEVAGKSIAARDITRQYFDVTHRLKADHAVLARLKSLLLKVRNVKESLLIEREMGRLLTRIEQYKGLLRYLKHHASLSTIKLHFRVKPRYSRRIRKGWRSPFGWVKGLGIWRMMRF